MTIKFLEKSHESNTQTVRNGRSFCHNCNFNWLYKRIQRGRNSRKKQILGPTLFRRDEQGNKSYLDEYFGANYIYHGSAGDLDAEGFKAQHDMFLTAFPDVKASVEDMIAVVDKVVTRWKIRGTHSGELQGMAPTGKEVTITGIIITRVDNGKAVEEWEAFDQLGLMQQLGAIPLPQNTNR